jgi:hypothetical protein
VPDVTDQVKGAIPPVTDSWADGYSDPTAAAATVVVAMPNAGVTVTVVVDDVEDVVDESPVYSAST